MGGVWQKQMHQTWMLRSLAEADAPDVYVEGFGTGKAWSLASSPNRTIWFEYILLTNDVSGEYSNTLRRKIMKS